MLELRVRTSDTLPRKSVPEYKNQNYKVADRARSCRKSLLVRKVTTGLKVVTAFFVTTTVVLQKALGRIFVMVRLCHSNNFGSL
jgi:hypothetical protein